MLSTLAIAHHGMNDDVGTLLFLFLKSFSNITYWNFGWSFIDSCLGQLSLIFLWSWTSIVLFQSTVCSKQNNWEVLYEALYVWSFNWIRPKLDRKIWKNDMIGTICFEIRISSKRMTNNHAPSDLQLLLWQWGASNIYLLVDQLVGY